MMFPHTSQHHETTRNAAASPSRAGPPADKELPADSTPLVNPDCLFLFLVDTRGRTDETLLLDQFLPADGPESAIALFRRHFELYHALYRIEDAFEEHGLKLDIGLAHVTVHEIPAEGSCRYFDGSFCRIPCTGSQYCAAHRVMQRRRSRAGAVEPASTRVFYLDYGNVTAMDSQRLSTLMRGTWNYVLHCDDIESSCDILGVDRSVSLARLRRRFRYLSKLHHPDSGGDAAQFSRIQSAYDCLLRFRSDFATTG